MRIATEILRRCWFLAGPTATGKSSAGVELALRIGAEIVSMDSAAVYRRMDLGTAKPTESERARVPHHLVDLVEPWEEFSVASYLTAADRICGEILGRGRVPLFVGGTGLYLRSLLRGLSVAPAADPGLREALEAEAAEHGDAHLFERLQRVDLAGSRRIGPGDRRRIVRALEVYTQMGRPLSDLQGESPLPTDLRPANIFWLFPPRNWLYQRVNERVNRMMAAGLLQEVRELLSASQGLSRSARQLLGYRQLIDHLEGRVSLEQAIVNIQTRTRQFAKRQHTWFRHLEECRPVTITGEEAPSAIAEVVLAAADFGSA